jgi:hypothetical protein
MHFYSGPPMHLLSGVDKSLVKLRAAYMPDAARAGFRVLPS